MCKIKISEVVFYPIRPTGKGLIGFASCVFDNKLSLNSIAVYTKPDGNGIRCLFPSRRLPNGKEVNIFYPINRETYEAVTEMIEKKIDDVVEKVRDENGQRRLHFMAK